MLIPTAFDVCILGGGIHGAAMLREASSRGLSCALIEHRDFASNNFANIHTSTNINLQKLEKLALYDMYRSAREQARLHKAAALWLKPMDYFVIPNAALRSSSKIRLGSQLLNRINKLKTEYTPQQAQDNLLVELPKHHQFGNLVADENRIVFSTIQQAQLLGATALNHCQIAHCERDKDQWKLELRQTKGSQRNGNISCKTLINCTGASASAVMKEQLHSHSRCQVRKVYNYYLIAKKTFDGNQGYVLQMPDGQLVYITPLNRQSIQLGPYVSLTPLSPPNVVNQVVAEYNKVFKSSLHTDDIAEVHLCGRAATEDPCENNSTELVDTFLDLNIGQQSALAPLLTLFGHNFTYHRHIAEKALGLLSPYVKAATSTIKEELALPGADRGSFDDTLSELKTAYPNLPYSLLSRLTMQYGSNSYTLLGQANSLQELGALFGDDIYEAEVAYAIQHEWVVCAEDFIRRLPPNYSAANNIDESKLGSFISTHFNQ